MGIKFFKSYCRKNGCEGTFKIFERSNYIYKKENKNTLILVDTSSLMFEIFGRFQHNLEEVFNFIVRMKEVCDKNHIELVFVLEGSAPQSKINELIKRAYQIVNEAIDFFEEPRTMEENKTVIYPFLFRPFLLFLEKVGFELIRAHGETDQRVIVEAINRKAYAIVSNDTDFYLSAVRHILFSDSFFQTIDKVSKRKIPYLSFEIQGIYTDKAKGKLKLAPNMYPFFSCLAGNDYTKSFSEDLFDKLKISEIKAHQHNFDKICSYLKQFKGDVETLQQTLCDALESEDDKKMLLFGLDQVRRMLTSKEEEIIEVEGLDLTNTKKRFSVVRGSLGVQLFYPPYCKIDEICVYNICTSLRKVLYDFVKPNSEIVEYYFDREKDIEESCIVKTDDHKSKDIIEICLRLGYQNEVIDVVKQSLNNEIDWWKTVYLLGIKYIEMKRETFEGFDFLMYEWYYLCKCYRTNHQPSAPFKGFADQRLPVHMYNYFSMILFYLNEIVIDLCDISPDYVYQLKSPFINEFANDYIVQRNTLNECIEKLRTEDEFFNFVCELFSTSKLLNTTKQLQIEE